MWQRVLRIAPVLLVMLLLYLAGCSKNPTSVLDHGRHQFPETELTYAPVEADTASFRVHLYWYGYDNDGQVVRFRFAIDSDTSKPFIKWHVTSAHDSIFTFQVAPGDLVGGHVFWVSAVDDDGRIDPTPAKRYFSIRTVPPTSQITGGPGAGSLTGSSVTFSWKGTDPDGGPTGGPIPADSFEILILRPGTSFDGNHTPLPDWGYSGSASVYQSLLNQGSGASLPAPYDDWKWVGTTRTSEALTGLQTGRWYVFAVRAVDPAGAREAKVKYFGNFRNFLVVASPESQSPPRMVISSDVLISGLSTFYPYPPIETIPVESRFPVLDGAPITFSWIGSPGDADYALAGYTTALDDTTTESWNNVDLTNTLITLPGNLSPGGHMLFIRLLDVTGGSAIAVLPLQIVHAAFRDPAQPPSMLYVDDFAPPPGTWYAAQHGSPNFPTDETEDDWWTRVILAPLARDHGMTFGQWDPVYLSEFSAYGRMPPTLDELAKHRVVIWSVDFNNMISSPVGLWTALQAGHVSGLREYVRGGGTLILTGFTLAANASRMSDIPNSAFSRGMCATLSPSNIDSRWIGEYFLRDYMGIDGAMSSDASRRFWGARDFVGANVTPEGMTLGFQAAEVDTGATGTGAKWNPYAFGDTDGLLAPGLPKVEGWKLETALGCHADESVYRRENPGLPIAMPLFTYHGVHEGVLQDGPASPREGLVVGIATQAHDNGKGDGSIITPGTASGVTGRMVFLGFPVYYMKDAQAYQLMRTAFEYVNGSPTLPGGAP